MGYVAKINCRIHDRRSETRRHHDPNVRARARAVKKTRLHWYIGPSPEQLAGSINSGLNPLRPCAFHPLYMDLYAGRSAAECVSAARPRMFRCTCFGCLVSVGRELASSALALVADAKIGPANVGYGPACFIIGRARVLKEGIDRCLRDSENHDEGIAIVGMAARFPGAQDVDAFWRNLLDGVESISHFTDAELEPSFYESAAIRAGANYVKSRGIIEDIDKFDASFFRFTPKDAAGIDPQQRVFLEIAWAALENAGCNPATYPGAIGVWAGMDPSTYLWENILPNRQLVEETGVFPVVLNNDKDYLATRLSYKLDLRGPSITLQTACSTGLVVVHNAFHGLLSYQCDVALAGVSSICVPQKRGYVFQEGAIGSRDGRCRPFDADASGTVFSDGVGVIVLKRLADAIADGDTIYAVIKGSALNNDGARKAGFSAPSVDGQAEAIAMAQALAGVSADTISYVEAHGTATPLGDPIEIAALTKAFRASTDKSSYCAIGSVKGNVGHLNSAAGIAGLIKAALALHHKKIPASLNFSKPNPQIDFASSPFVVNTQLNDWPEGPTPRRAGVSSFGIGGTNAHVVLEEAPRLKPTHTSRKEQLLVLSAKSATALAEAADRLADYLRTHPGRTAARHRPHAAGRATGLPAPAGRRRAHGGGGR